MKKAVVRIFKHTRGFFPSALPVGVDQFNGFADSIFDLYGLPNLPSYKHAIASIVMHLGPTTAYKSKFFFSLTIKKSMANQIAYEVIQSLKKLENEYIEATLAKEPTGTQLEPVQQ